MGTKEENTPCFIIMPFSGSSKNHTEEYWTRHYEEFLKPLIKNAGNYFPFRSQALRGDIVREIIGSLIFSPIIVADLTDANPNVYWELGIRQSFKHGTITIAEKGTHLPFDIGVKGTLFYYPNDYTKMEEFKANFKKALDNCLEEPEKPDSHVLEAITGRGSIYQIIIDIEAKKRLEALIDEIEDNSELLGRIISHCKTNQEKPKERQYPISTIRYSCFEYLIVTRYLDQSDRFYKLFGNIFNLLYSYNHQLLLWPHRPDQVEKFFLEEEERIIGTMQQVKEFVVELRQELENKNKIIVEKSKE
jgi:hypothetical protein